VEIGGAPVADHRQIDAGSLVSLRVQCRLLVAAVARPPRVAGARRTIALAAQIGSAGDFGASAAQAARASDGCDTAYKCQSPGTPFSDWVPRSSNTMPEPATRSLTVLDTSTSLGAARAATRAPMCTAMPLYLLSVTSHSPVCSPART